METTIGQLMLNDLLPEDLRDHKRVIDKKTIRALYTELADRYPDRYRDVNQALHELGADAATVYGRTASLSLDSFRVPEVIRKHHRELQAGVQKILEGPGKREEKDEKIVELISGYIDRITDDNFQEGLKSRNPLAIQILSGARGNTSQFRSLRGGDLLVVDHKDNPIPIPILSSYSEGLDPVQYWAGAYGARKGEISKKFATPKAGYLGKQLTAAAHRVVVTEKDCGTSNGILVPANDPDNEGAVLASTIGSFQSGQVLDPEALKTLGNRQVLVRSVMTCQAERGVCQKCAGIREKGRFPPIGDNIGIASAQAIAEPLAQGMLSEKHKGGLATQKATVAKTGIDLINQLVQVPQTFSGSAAISMSDGRVEDIADAPQGGKFVVVGGAEHWVPVDQSVSVKKGDVIEAGDVLSSGIPNPALIAEHKGIGEGRRYFMDIFRKSLAEGGFANHRRNLEVMARGLVNHVRITDLDGPNDTMPDDVAEYDDIVRGYQPRFGFKVIPPSQAAGLYLEKPVLHYSIGTRVTPRVAKTLGENKIESVMAHADPPSFVPEMTRAMETLAHSDDWMVRMGGLYGVKRSVLKGIHRGIGSDIHGTSFMAPLARGVEFGKDPEKKGY